MRFLVALAASLLACSTSSGFAQQPATPELRFVDGEATMKGMPGLYVVVENIPDLQGQLTAETLQTSAELRLRQAGIEVFRPDSPLYRFAPYLYINVNVIRTNHSGYVYNVDVAFRRLVEAHDGSNFMNLLKATTWDTGTVGIAPYDDVRGIREVVDDGVSKFLNTFLAANPKK